jgi:hypothetical protein
MSRVRPLYQLDAYGASEDPEDTYPINYCYWCTCDQWHMPDYLLCYSEICKGGIFYDF